MFFFLHRRSLSICGGFPLGVCSRRQVLEPGDLLFLPRGFVHQAEALATSAAEAQPSLHVTLSTAQNNAWADLLELVVRS